jgi:hypothetical protein
VLGEGSASADASGVGGIVGARTAPAFAACSDGRSERRSWYGISPSSWRIASTNSAGKRGGFIDGDGGGVRDGDSRFPPRACWGIQEGARRAGGETLANFTRRGASGMESASNHRILVVLE